MALWQKTSPTVPGRQRGRHCQRCTRRRIIDFIGQLPLGFATRIWRAWTKLSGGQRQRLAWRVPFSRTRPSWCWTRLPAPWTTKPRPPSSALTIGELWPHFPGHRPSAVDRAPGRLHPPDGRWPHRGKWGRMMNPPEGAVAVAAVADRERNLRMYGFTPLFCVSS